MFDRKNRKDTKSAIELYIEKHLISNGIYKSMSAQDEFIDDVIRHRRIDALEKELGLKEETGQWVNIKEAELSRENKARLAEYWRKLLQ